MNMKKEVKGYRVKYKISSPSVDLTEEQVVGLISSWGIRDFKLRNEPAYSVVAGVTRVNSRWEAESLLKLDEFNDYLINFLKSYGYLFNTYEITEIRYSDNTTEKVSQTFNLLDHEDN